MTDSLERFLQDLDFEVPIGLADRAAAAAAADYRRRLPRRQPWALALVAIVLAIAIVATLVFGVRALHSTTPIPGNHGRVIPRYHNGQIVLASDTTLIAIDPDTGAQHPILSVQADVGVLELSDPTYSPDGTRIAYLRRPERTIWVLDIATGHNEQLTTCSAPACDKFNRLSWSPDGLRLAFSDSDESGGAQLFVIKADGTERRQLTHLQVGERATQPSWSPDGTLIAFTRLRTSGARTGSSDIDAIRPDGTHLSVLLANVKEQSDHAGNGSGYLEPVWSPDGSRIAYVLIPTSLSTSGWDFHYQLWLMDPDGSHRQKIFENYNECCGPGRGGLAWSPDGTRISVFVGGQGITRDVGTLWVMNADGSDRVSFGFFPGYSHPTWQPVA
jgi:Tol biopolymer transport system component